MIRTDTFVDVCKKCSGSGRKYFHVNHVIKQEICPSCSGKGYAYKSFSHDCRDFDEWDRLWNLARKRSREDKQIISAIENQKSNPAFENRDGLLRVHAERHVDFNYWTETHHNAGFARGKAKDVAWKSFWQGLLVAVGISLILVVLYYTTQQIVFLFGGLLGGLLVFGVSVLVLFAKISKADWTYGEIHRLYESKEFWAE